MKDFLASHQKMKAIDQRLDGIKRILHGYPGEKMKEAELKEWRNTVKQVSVSAPRLECKDPASISLRGFNWIFNGWNHETMVTITGNHAEGYSVVNPARTVY